MGDEFRTIVTADVRRCRVEAGELFQQGLISRKVLLPQGMTGQSPVFLQDVKK